MKLLLLLRQSAIVSNIKKKKSQEVYIQNKKVTGNNLRKWNVNIYLETRNGLREKYRLFKPKLLVNN